MSMNMQQRGVSLIEVLVTLIIISVGLLGLAAMQTRALQFNHGAYLRSQATVLASDIMDRMRLNRTVAQADGYNIAITDGKPTGTSRRDVDLNEWLTLLETSLPGGDGSVNCGSNRCTITVQWQESAEANASSFSYQTQI